MNSMRSTYTIEGGERRHQRYENGGRDKCDLPRGNYQHPQHSVPPPQPAAASASSLTFVPDQSNSLHEAHHGHGQPRTCRQAWGMSNYEGANARVMDLLRRDNARLSRANDELVTANQDLRNEYGSVLSEEEKEGELEALRREAASLKMTLAVKEVELKREKERRRGILQQSAAAAQKRFKAQVQATVKLREEIEAEAEEIKAEAMQVAQAREDNAAKEVAKSQAEAAQLRKQVQEAEAKAEGLQSKLLQATQGMQEAIDAKEAAEAKLSKAEEVAGRKADKKIGKIEAQAAASVGAAEARAERLIAQRVAQVKTTADAKIAAANARAETFEAKARKLREAGRKRPRSKEGRFWHYAEVDDTPGAAAGAGEEDGGAGLEQSEPHAKSVKREVEDGDGEEKEEVGGEEAEGEGAEGEEVEVCLLSEDTTLWEVSQARLDAEVLAPPKAPPLASGVLPQTKLVVQGSEQDQWFQFLTSPFTATATFSIRFRGQTKILVVSGIDDSEAAPKVEWRVYWPDDQPSSIHIRPSWQKANTTKGRLRCGLGLTERYRRGEGNRERHKWGSRSIEPLEEGHKQSYFRMDF